MDDLLLPLDESIELGGRRVHVQNVIGSGFTGEVYSGELIEEDGMRRRVAIKAMKDIEFKEARQFFDQESLTLALLQDYEAQMAQTLRTELKIIPYYYGRGLYEQTPFFVMEFITGETIPDLLEKQERMTESAALTAAWHLYLALDLLHSRMGKAFIDLKFENLWWIVGEGSTEGQLKLTDFGTLVDINEGSRRYANRDLLLSAVYLMKMLTGVMLDYSLGMINERPEPVIRMHREELSWGTRRLLNILLHRNADLRLGSAAEIAAELRILVNYWGQESPENLLDIAEVNLKRAEKLDEEDDAAADFAARARSALSIYKRLSKGYTGKGGRFAGLVTPATAILNHFDPFERGYRLFMAGEYAASWEIFREGMYWSANPGKLRRWSYAANMGMERGEDLTHYRDQVERLVNKLDAGDFVDIDLLLSRLPQALPETEGGQCLQKDIQFWRLVQQSLGEQTDRMGAMNYKYRSDEEIAKLYLQAIGNLELICDKKFVCSEEFREDDLWDGRELHLDRVQEQGKRPRQEKGFKSVRLLV